MIEEIILKTMVTTIFAVTYYFLSKLIGFEQTVFVALAYIISNQFYNEVE